MEAQNSFRGIGTGHKTKHRLDNAIGVTNWRALEVAKKSEEIFGRKEIGPERFELSTS